MAGCQGIMGMGRLVCLLTLGMALGCGGISTRSGETDEDGGAASSRGGSPGTSPKTGGAPSHSGGAPASSHSGGAPSHAGNQPAAGAPVVAGGAGGGQPLECGAAEPAPAPSSACRGIKTGLFCAPEGQACPCLRCGLADLGRRGCSCSGDVWTCSACQFPPGWQWPPDLPLCIEQADKLPCFAEGQACQSAPGGEACLCYRDDEGQLIWDCDKPPVLTPY